MAPKGDGYAPITLARLGGGDPGPGRLAAVSFRPGVVIGWLRR